MIPSKIRVKRLIKAAVLLTWWAIPAFVLPLQAWNRTGHRAIASIAYSKMNPVARRRVDALLRAHPDYARLVEGASGTPQARARAAFLAASIWPDDIRRDSRFFDDNAQPTPPLGGFPDMGRHPTWHYIDIPFSSDGTPVPDSPPSPNALTQISAFRKTIADAGIPESIRAYQLSWLLHLIGDVHQPLHCVSRFRAEQRDKETNRFVPDQGGNLVLLENGKTLHAFWDGLPGDADDEESVAALAKDLMQSHKRDAPGRLNEREWIDESFRIAKQSVYGFSGEGTRRHPALLSGPYRAMASRIGRDRVALAAYRLAAVLNEIFSN